MAGMIFGHDPIVTVDNVSGHVLELGHAHNLDQASHAQAGHAQESHAQTAPVSKKSRLSLGRNRNEMPKPSPPAIIPPCKC